MEWTSDKPGEHLSPFFEIIIKSYKFLDKWFQSNLFPVHLERSFKKLAKSYSSKVQKSSNFEYTPKTSFPSKRFSRHVKCNCENPLHTFGDIECILYKPAHTFCMKIQKCHWTNSSIRQIFPSERSSPWGECSFDQPVETFTPKVENRLHINRIHCVKVLVFQWETFLSNILSVQW